MERLVNVIAQMTQNNPTLNLLMLMVIVWKTGVIFAFSTSHRSWAS